MSNKPIAKSVLLTVLMFGLAAPACAQAKKHSTTPDDAKAKQAYALGIQAYIWATRWS